jgi:hypothetical protein
VFEINTFFDDILGFLKTLQENGMEEEEIKKNLKDLLLKYFEQTANVDTTSKKVNRNKEKIYEAIAKVEVTLDQVNKNLLNMDVANDVAQKANEEAKKFNDQANELANMMEGNNIMMIVILVVVGLLLGVAVFANLYATINAPPPAPVGGYPPPPPRRSEEKAHYLDPVDYSSGKGLLSRSNINRPIYTIDIKTLKIQI